MKKKPLKIEVTFVYEPDPEDIDAEHETGLTPEAYDKLCDRIGSLFHDGEISEVEKQS